jgi:hypothetical protein
VTVGKTVLAADVAVPKDSRPRPNPKRRSRRFADCEEIPIDCNDIPILLIPHNFRPAAPEMLPHNRNAGQPRGPKHQISMEGPNTRTSHVCRSIRCCPGKMEPSSPIQCTNPPKETKIPDREDPKTVEFLSSSEEVTGNSAMGGNSSLERGEELRGRTSVPECHLPWRCNPVWPHLI